ncbi:J domain-containing protein [Myxococcus landrumensis]|uniref:J domain-containing protein n=2 Tax=Myxococcus landrumensis TaxID=2813577 RepID=A0ABX7NHF3_9BACT|nr:J domain-containing protein [Myxococcus landrumus]
MRACPCCMETLTPGLLGFGSRRLAGRCEVCGDAVCEACWSARGVEGKGPLCRSCVWEALTEQGLTPDFVAPPGQRQRARRAARAACAHTAVTPCMGFCPTCGDEVAWKSEHGNPSCEACGAPSHRTFNCCWACGESFEEDNAPQEVARGYRLDFACEAGDCSGRMAWLMPFCPWCGEEKHWPHPDELKCMECESSLDRSWAFCVRCGDEAPLPDECPRCGLELEKAASAARCEQCRHIVCGDCCDVHVAESTEGAPQERMLCSECGDKAAPSVSAEETSREAPEEEDVEEEEEEPVKPPPPPSAAPQSPWEVLGVAPGAPLAEAKRAYLALVAQYHPDKVAALGPKLQALALEETRRIIEAWETVRKQARPGR